MTIVVSNNVTNVQVSDSAAARADRLLAEAAAAAATGSVPTNSAIVRVTSIANLKALPGGPDTSKTYIVTGYYSDGDGGGGVFRAVSGGTYTDDGGLTIVPGVSVGGTGSTAWLRVVDGMLSVKMFGAKGNVSTDDSTAMQAAHNTGQIIFYPPGTYTFGSQITFERGGIIGASPNETILRPTGTATSNAIFCSTSQPSLVGLTFQNFQMQPGVSKTGGYMIIVTRSGSGTYAQCEFFNVTFFQNIAYAIRTYAADFWTIDSCTFGNCREAGIVIDSPNPDSQGGTIVNCIFFNGGTGGTMAHILHLQAGGMMVKNNRFLGGNYCYKIEYTGGAPGTIANSQADTLLTGNYFGIPVVACVHISKTTGTTSMSGIEITANKFEGQYPPAVTDLIYVAPSSGNYINGMYIHSNVFWASASGGSCIALNNINGIKIVGNSFLGTSANTGIYIDSNCNNVHVSGNNLEQIGSNLNINATSNVYVEGTSAADRTRWFYDPSSTSVILSAQQANDALKFRVNGSDQLALYDLDNVVVTGSFSRGNPATKTADFSLSTIENWIINNKSGSALTVTLPAPSTYSGREVMFQNYQAQNILSSLTNVTPQGGGAATNVIVSSTQKFATIVSNGSSWVVMAAG